MGGGVSVPVDSSSIRGLSTRTCCVTQNGTAVGQVIVCFTGGFSQVLLVRAGIVYG